MLLKIWFAGAACLALALFCGCDDDSPCEPGQTLCGGVCCDGTCCDGTCCDGECLDGTCDPCAEGLTQCLGRCVDLSTDPDHCGACGVSCPDEQVCWDGQCAGACPEGLEDCSGVCVDLRSDPAHCGRCERVCDETQECLDGACVALPTADGFTSQGPGDSDEAAALFGVREVLLETGDGSVSNPFDTELLVTFTPPSGRDASVTVRGFYDGGDLWRARVYVTEVGRWTWSTSSEDAGLDGLEGSFDAIRSRLRGKLRAHPENLQRWATEDGRFFLTLADTAYLLFNDEIEEEVFQRYVEDIVERGVTLTRVGYGGGYSVWEPGVRASGDRYPRSNWIHDERDYDRFDLSQLQASDGRLAWLLNNAPGLYIDLHLLPKSDDSGRRWYESLTETQRARTLEQLVARLAAFPQVLFLIERDVPHTYNTWQQNLQLCREVGRTLAQLDPWDTFRGCNEKSRELNQLIEPSDFDQWQSYLEVQSWGYPHGRAVEHYYETVDGLPVHVYQGEDAYESPWLGRPAHPAYYYRRLFWSNLLSGGSGTYGSLYKSLIPYDETGTTPYFYNDTSSVTSQLQGLDEVIHIAEFFGDHGLDLAEFRPDDSVARLRDRVEPEGDRGPSRVQAARDGVDRFLLYHPNAADGELSSETIADSGEVVLEPVQSRYDATPRAGRRPGVEVDLGGSSAMRYSVTWFHPTTGESFEEEPVEGGAWTAIAAPEAFEGSDAVLYLQAERPRSFIVAHRGGGSGADGWAPENTMAAFEKCFANGVAVETDVNVTSDGELILFHGGQLSATTDGEGAPTERTLEYVRSLDAAATHGWSDEYSPQRVPTLAELLDAFSARAAPGTFIVADAHRVGTLEAMRSMLRMIDARALFDRVHLQVFDLAQAETLRTIATELFGAPDRLRLAIWVAEDRTLLRAAVASGLFMEVHAASSLVDEAARIPASIRFVGGDGDWGAPGVDGIGTDFVDRALERVQGRAPTAVIVEPREGARLPAGEIRVRVETSDSDGSIVGVDLYAGLRRLGTDETRPFELTWSDAAPGSYVLRARVRDGGRHRTSAPVHVVVE